MVEQVHALWLLSTACKPPRLQRCLVTVSVALVWRLLSSVGQITNVSVPVSLMLLLWLDIDIVNQMLTVVVVDDATAVDVIAQPCNERAPWDLTLVKLPLPQPLFLRCL